MAGCKQNVHMDVMSGMQPALNSGVGACPCTCPPLDCYRHSQTSGLPLLTHNDVLPVVAGRVPPHSPHLRQAAGQVVRHTPHQQPLHARWGQALPAARQRCMDASKLYLPQGCPCRHPRPANLCCHAVIPQRPLLPTLETCPSPGGRHMSRQESTSPPQSDT